MQLLFVVQLLAHFGCAALLSALVNWVGLIRWRKASGAHWTEQARILWPVRFTAGLNVFLLPPILNLAHAALFPELPHSWIPDLFAGFFGAVLGCFPFDRELFPQLGFRDWCYHALAGWGIRFGIWGLLVAGCALMPEEAGWPMFAVAAGYLACHMAIQWGLILKYLRLVKFLTPADERLNGLVTAVAARMRVSVRATWQLDGVAAVAFAFPTSRDVVFSRRLLEICSDEEIAAICAHELAHLTEGKTMLAGRLLGSLALFPLIFIGPLVHKLGLWGLFLPYLALFGLLKISRWVSQRMEKRADQLAVTDQSEAGVFARALEKLYRENKIPAVNVNNKQTHPHLYDRLTDAGMAPDYPRPAKPRRLTVFGWASFVLLGICLVLFAVLNG